MIIIKFGGSVICDKEKPFSFNKKTVEEIVDEIAIFYPEKKFIIVHGGGSFGHPLAKKYRIRDGLNEKNIIGICKTHEAMLMLNKLIVEIFLNKNLPAFPFPPSAIFIMEKGEIIDGWVKNIEEMLNKNFIPILFGDVAIAREKGVDILSGDQIITYLAKKLKPEKVIFLMDVDGIFDRNPMEKDAKLIELINEEIKIEADTGKFDVTGGIRNKIEEALKMPCQVYFINGMVRGNIVKAIKGEKVGTVKI